MAEISLKQPETPDIFSFGFNKNLNRNFLIVKNPLISNSIEDLIGGALLSLNAENLDTITLIKLKAGLNIRNITDSSSNQVAVFTGNERVTAATNDEGYISFNLTNSAKENVEFGRLVWRASGVVNGSENMRFYIKGMSGGSLVDLLYIAPDSGITTQGILSAKEFNGQILLATARGRIGGSGGEYGVAGTDGSPFIVGDLANTILGGYSFAKTVISDGALTEASTGNHALIAGLRIKVPTITGAGATVTDTASLYIDGAMSATVTGDNYGLWIDSGPSRFDGRVLSSKGADIASAGTVTLGGDGNYFDITGTTTINYITTTGWTAGSVIILQFDSSVTVTHNAAAPPASTAALLLSGSANFSATANDTLQLVYDGTTWREVSRTVI